jgi:5-dehydro-2-deoxygluconokinase
VPYRDNCADLELTIGDVMTAPVAASRALLVTGSGLSRQPSRDATLFAAEQAREGGNRVVLDLDVRAELWPDMRAYAASVRSILPHTNVVIGTVEEVAAAVARDGQATRGAAIESPDSFGDALKDSGSGVARRGVGASGRRQARRAQHPHLSARRRDN